MPQVIKIKRLIVETEERRPITPIAIIPCRISLGIGSSELLENPGVALTADLFASMASSTAGI
jgi:hypothetical protein